MTLTLSNAVRSAMADAGLDLLDAGSGAGKIRVYTGTRPAGPDTALGAQTLLLEFTLSDPGSAAAVNGVKQIDVTPVPAAVGLAAGTAAWFRALDSANVARVDGRVTATGGGGDLTLSTTTVSIGLDVNLTGGTFTMPAGTAD